MAILRSGTRGPRGDMSNFAEDGPLNEPRRLLEKSHNVVAKSVLKGDLGPIHLASTSTASPAGTTAIVQKDTVSETVVIPTTHPPFTQQHKFLENQHAAVTCAPDQFISRLHITYTSEPARSTYFTYSFRFRRQPLQLPNYGASAVVRDSCHGLKFCVGHRACLFQVSSKLCLHDPSPSRKKVGDRFFCACMCQVHVVCWLQTLFA